MENILADLRKELIKNSDEKTKQTGHHFFKEEVQIIGVKTASVRKIGKEFSISKQKPKKRYLPFVSIYGKRDTSKNRLLPVTGHFASKKNIPRKTLSFLNDGFPNT